MTDKKPIKKFSCGNVSLAIWENEITKDGKKVPMRNVSLSKDYMDSDQKWHSSNNFGINEIPKAQVVLDMAYKFMLNTKELDGNT